MNDERLLICQSLVFCSNLAQTHSQFNSFTLQYYAVPAQFLPTDNRIHIYVTLAIESVVSTDIPGNTMWIHCDIPRVKEILLLKVI